MKSVFILNIIVFDVKKKYIFTFIICVPIFIQVKILYGDLSVRRFIGIHLEVK